MTSKRSARNTVTVTFTGPKDYEALTKLAGEQDRTNAEQARHMLRAALRNSQTLRGGHEPETHDITGATDPNPKHGTFEPAPAKQEPLLG